MSVARSHALAASTLQPIRVVLCDDAGAVRALVRQILEEDAGIQVVAEVDNARDCVRVVGTLSPRVVVLDVAMPGLDGLRAIPLLVSACRRTAVIVLSSLAADSVRERALELGAERFLEKGLQAHVLSGTVREVAAGQGWPAVSDASTPARPVRGDGPLRRGAGGA